MSKLVFLTIATLTAAILSLYSMTAAQAFASDDSGGGVHVPKQPQSFQPDKGTAPKNVRNFGDKGVQIGDFPSPNSNDNSGGSDHHHIGGKIGKINRLFRSDSLDTGQSAIDSIPVIQPLNSTQSNATTTATVTIPVCDGVRGGPCLDKTTGQIIP